MEARNSFKTRKKGKSRVHSALSSSYRLSVFACCRMVSLFFLLPAAHTVCASSLSEDTPTTVSLSLYEPVAPSVQEAFLKKMAAALGAVRSIRADFVQERHLVLFLDTLTAKGVCRFEAPARIRWELTEPYVSILIHNDRRAAKFDLEEGRLRKMRLGAEDALREMLGQIMAWMRGDFRETRKTYDLELLKGRDWLLILKPRSKGMRDIIHAVEIAIQPDTFHATAVTIREPQGDWIRILFRDMRINPSLDPALFDLENPKYPALDAEAGPSKPFSEAP